MEKTERCDKHVLFINTINVLTGRSAIFLLLLFLFWSNAQAGIRYVRAGASGTGVSWADASGNLQAMINASAAGDEVWVAAGTYKPEYTAAGWTPTNHPASNGNRDNAFVMKPDVRIYGGFPSDANDVDNNILSSRNLTLNQTVLSGDINANSDDAYHVVIAAGNLGNAALDGFTITGGYGNNGSGSITVNSKTIDRNHGGGIIVNGTMTFSNLTVKNNISGYGSGIFLNGSGSESSAFTNIVIAGNTGAQDGGGIYVRNVTHTMTNVTVAGNRGDYGGGICIRGGVLNLRNSIVWGNYTKNGGSINNADVNNGSLNHSCNLLQDFTMTTGATNIVANTDPLFTGAGAGDYSLQPNSPAIDMGNKTLFVSGNADLAGNLRVQGCDIDLGAYERPVSIVPTATGTVYVKEGGSGNGSSWDNAYPNLALPLRLAKVCGITEIRVAEGTYKPVFAPTTGIDRDKTFLMVAGVKIYGGFSKTLTGASDAPPPVFGTAERQGVSILSGDIGVAGTAADNAFHVVMAAGNMGAAILDGFTIAGGYGGSGNITVNSKTIDRNHGGGITVNGTMTFSNLTVKGNISGYGSGIHLNGSGSESSVFTNIVIDNNTEAQDGGGIYVRSATHTMTNITVAGNRSDHGGGICIRGGVLNLRNSIVWGNYTKNGVSINNADVSGGTLNHSYNLLQGFTMTTGATNIVANTDPLFTASGAGDYSLQPNSPAIDMGNRTLFVAGDTDLAGNPRTQGCNIDLGAYERPVSIVPTAGRVYVKADGAGNGSSWDKAYPNLALPLRLAKTCGITEILVAEGSYKPMFAPTTDIARDKTFLMVEGVKIHGGFDGTLTGAPAVVPAFGTAGRQGESILSGDIDSDNVPDADNVHHVVMAAGSMGAAILDGFTISGGYGNSSGNVTVNGKTIDRNHGGGITVNGTMTFSNLTVKGNISGYGSGIFLNGSDNEGSAFTNIVIAGNTGAQDGGGIYVKNVTHTMTNVTVTGNRGDYGGGICVRGGVLNLRNSIVWGNYTKNGGSINNADVSGGSLNHSYNLLQGFTMTTGATNIVANTDPLFTASGSGDYSLQPNSPAIDMGNGTLFASGGTDLSGNPRVQGCDIDLGAYERSVSIVPTAGRVYVKAGGSGNGSSWDNAYPNLALPLRLAKTCGITEILVAEGSYKPMFAPTTDIARDKTFLMVAGVKIHGGFDGALTGSPAVVPAFGTAGRQGESILSGDIDNDNVLDADNVHHVVMAAGSMGAAILDGFTVSGGYGNSSSGNVTVNGKGIEGNHGGGITVNGTMMFSNLTVKGNISGYGSGIHLNGSGSESSVFTNIVITGNTEAQDGGGIYVRNATHTVTNITVVDNRGDYGGGICIRGGGLNLRNSVVWGNTKKNGSTQNNIDVNNGNISHFYNLVEGAPVTTGSTTVISNADPKFVAAGNYRLQPNSPAIDVGSSTFYETGKQPDLSGVTADLDGNLRIRNCKIDLGAYETPGIVVPANGRVYVKEGASGDGSSWDSPYPNLAFPLYQAQRGCDGITEIWVAEGTYKPMYSPINNEARDRTFLMVEGVKIYGGFSGTLTGAPVVPQAFGTAGRQGESILSGDIDSDNVLDADNVYHVVIASGDMRDALLDGFTIAGGYGNSGGNIAVNGKSIERNHGGGVTVNGTMTFLNLTVKGNISGYGSGIHLNGSGSESSALTNILITGNTEAQDGGGIYVRNATHTATNITVVDNRGDYGGGICIRGGGLNLRNSVVWGNTRKNGSTRNNVDVNNGTLNHFYNLVQDASVTTGSTTVISSADPKFVAAASGNYRLQPDSPAIDVGDNTPYSAGQIPDLTGVANDLDGNTRIRNCKIDLGAYETVSVAATSGIVYVKEGATGNGSSWDNAYPSLAFPLYLARLGCDGITQIWVAEGTYKPMYSPVNNEARDRTFLLAANVKIYGGFSGTLTGAPVVPQSFGTAGRQGESVLSGDIDNDNLTDADNVYHVVMAAGDMGAAIVDGFTIAGGYGNNGSGSITVNSKTVERNHGGGVTVNGTVTFSNLTVKNNVSGYGSGIHLNGSGSERSTFTNTVVAGNIDAQDGGGIYVRNATHTMTNVTVVDNRGDYGGGICIRGGVLNLRNSVVS